MALGSLYRSLMYNFKKCEIYFSIPSINKFSIQMKMPYFHTLYVCCNSCYFRKLNVPFTHTTLYQPQYWAPKLKSYSPQLNTLKGPGVVLVTLPVTDVSASLLNHLWYRTSHDQ
jgi:hypothetical protein